MAEDDVDGLRVSQRAPRRCIECARRRIKCDRTIPCSECTKRGVADACRREKVRLTTKAHDDFPDIRGPSPSSSVRHHMSTAFVEQVSGNVREMQAEIRMLRQQVRDLEHAVSAANSAKNWPSPPRSRASSAVAVSSIENEKDEETTSSVSFHAYTGTLRTPISEHRECSSPSPEHLPTESGKPEIFGLDGHAELRPLLHVTQCPTVGKVTETAAIQWHQEPNEIDSRASIEPAPPDDPKGQATTSYEYRQKLWSQAGTTIYFEPTPHQDLDDQHQILCVLLFGWKYVRSRYNLSPLWDLLEQIYRNCYWDRVNEVTRLLMMDFCWRVIKARAAGCNDAMTVLPKFCRPTVMEDLVSSKTVMTRFYPWPGVREKMITNPSRYQTNAFTAAYLSQGRFLFPSLAEAYTRLPGTNMLAFTPEWLRRRDDLNCYTVTRDFLQWYPEFQGCIRQFTPSPNSVPSAGSPDISRRFLAQLRSARTKKLRARAVQRTRGAISMAIESHEELTVIPTSCGEDDRFGFSTTRKVENRVMELTEAEQS